MAIETPGRLNLQQFASELQNYDLDFENVIIHSRLREFEKRVDDSGLSIKLGVRGREDYVIDRERHSISPDHYLVVNKHQQFDCFLRSRETVEAFCIYLSPEIVAEAWRGLIEKTEAQLDNPVAPPQRGFFFQERVYHLDENELGRYLRRLRDQLLRPGIAGELDFGSLYYEIAEKLVQSQLHIDRQIGQIEASRQATREELYRRLCIAHQYILDNYTAGVSLDKLSRAAALSKFHLLRTYKQVYGVTPYQQTLRLRLHKARDLIRRRSHSLEAIAFDLGFSDRRSFSKAYKKAFAVTPSCEQAYGS